MIKGWRRCFTVQSKPWFIFDCASFRVQIIITRISNVSPHMSPLPRGRTSSTVSRLNPNTAHAPGQLRPTRRYSFSHPAEIGPRVCEKPENELFGGVWIFEIDCMGKDSGRGMPYTCQ